MQLNNLSNITKESITSLNQHFHLTTVQYLLILMNQLRRNFEEGVT